MDSDSKNQYDDKGNASHYDDRVNVLTKIEHIYGTYQAALFCEITEFKYRMRIGKKEGQSTEQELTKAKWYAEAAKMLFAKMGTTNHIQAAPEGNPMRKILNKT